MTYKNGALRHWSTSRRNKLSLQYNWRGRKNKFAAPVNLIKSKKWETPRAYKSIETLLLSTSWKTLLLGKWKKFPGGRYSQMNLKAALKTCWFKLFRFLYLPTPPPIPSLPISYVSSYVSSALVAATSDFEFNEAEFYAHINELIASVRSLFFEQTREWRTTHKTKLSSVVTEEAYNALFPPGKAFVAIDMVCSYLNVVDALFHWMKKKKKNLWCMHVLPVPWKFESMCVHKSNVQCSAGIGYIPCSCCLFLLGELSNFVFIILFPGPNKSFYVMHRSSKITDRRVIPLPSFHQICLGKQPPKQVIAQRQQQQRPPCYEASKNSQG